ncbi:hypothetical protein AAHC03_0767 [Spirometra sp. Aus1]
MMPTAMTNSPRLRPRSMSLKKVLDLLKEPEHLFKLHFRSDFERTTCERLLHDRYLLTCGMKAVIGAARERMGIAGGHISESLSAKLFCEAKVHKVFRLMGVDTTQFLGLHCGTFYNVGFGRKQMTTDFYLRIFIPTFSRELEALVESTQPFYNLLIAPVVLMIFRKDTVFGSVRDRIIVEHVMAHKNLFRQDLRQAPMGERRPLKAIERKEATGD